MNGHPYIQELAQLVSWAITSGTALAVYRSVRHSIRKRRAGAPVRNISRRVDIVRQRDDALRLAGELRAAAIRAGADPDSLPLAAPASPERTAL